MTMIIKNRKRYCSTSGDAKDIIYNNENSSLEATDVQNAIDEINFNLTADIPFKFGKNEEGKYGYIVTDEDGADTVIPFNSGSKGFDFVYKEAGFKTGLSIDTTNELYAVLFAYDGRKYNSSTYNYDYLYSEPKEQILNILTLTNGIYEELDYTEYSIPGYAYTPDIGETVDGTYVACVGRLVLKCVPSEGATMSFSVPMAVGEMGGGFVFEKVPI